MHRLFFKPTSYTYITELPPSAANISNSPEMKKFSKELSAAVRIKDMNKASEIQSQMDEFEEKAKSSRPKRWQYEGKINYYMSTIISRSLYIFTSLFNACLYIRLFSITSGPHLM